MDQTRDGSPGTSTRLIVGISWLATAALAVATGAAMLGQRSWAFELTTHFVMQYAWAAGLVALAFLLTRRWLGLLVAGGLCALHALCVVGVYADRPLGPRLHHPPLRLLMLNVNSSNTRRDATLELIEAEDPDVVLLMEVDSDWLDGLGPLAAGYPHRLAVPREDNFGIAAYSKQPWVSGRVVELEDPAGEELPSLEVRLENGGHPLVLFFTHPVPPVGPRMAHRRDELLRAAPRHAQGLGPRVVLAGDLNSTPWSPIFREVMEASGMRDTRQGFGIQPTWLAGLPSPFRIPIDHLFVTADVLVIERRVGPDVGSDHLPLIVDLR